MVWWKVFRSCLPLLTVCTDYIFEQKPAGLELWLVTDDLCFALTTYAVDCIKNQSVNLHCQKASGMSSSASTTFNCFSFGPISWTTPFSIESQHIFQRQKSSWMQTFWAAFNEKLLFNWHNFCTPKYWKPFTLSWSRFLTLTRSSAGVLVNKIGENT